MTDKASTKELVEVRHLKSELSDDRRRELGNEMGEALYQAERLEGLMKDMQKEQKTAISKNKSRAQTIARDIHNGFEMRPVTCRKVVDHARKLVTVYRQDTNEKIHEEPLVDGAAK